MWLEDIAHLSEALVLLILFTKLFTIHFSLFTINYLTIYLTIGSLTCFSPKHEGVGLDL